MTNFTERAARAIADESFRVAHFPPLIAEGQQVAEQLHATIEQAIADSIDFSLSEDDREEAATLADRSRRQFATVVSAIEALEAKYAERQASEKGARIEAERQAAIAERDELAERFRVIVPQAVAALTELFGLVEANAQRLAKAGVRAPDAEATARGLKGYFNGGPIDRFLMMKIPEWAGKGRAWPLQRSRRIYDPEASRERMERHVAHQDAEREASYRAYRFYAVEGEVIPLRGRKPGEKDLRQFTLAGAPVAAEVLPAELERLQQRGVRFEAIEQEPAHG